MNEFSEKVIPEVMYFLAYVLVSDKKIYDREWFELNRFIEANCCDENVKKEINNILLDKEEKIPFDSVLKTLSDSSDYNKNIAIEEGLRISICDGNYNKDEEVLLERAVRDLKFDHIRFLESKDRIIREFETYKNNHKRIKNKYFYSEEFISRCSKNLFANKNYDKMIRKISRIAKDDIKLSNDILNKNMIEENQIVNESKKGLDTLSNLKLKSEEKNVLNSQISGIFYNIKNMIEDGKKQAEELYKKTTGASDKFTISFMGRTKAGKSTLHSVFLGGLNEEFIGKGGERTTRFNYVYEWNNIRIIDTPGIGAPGGLSDKEIAKSIIDESDLIIYVVTSDSIQETEFQFMSELKGKNKSFIILLNKKENFMRTEKKKMDFINNPLSWYELDGEDSIQGHINRIREYIIKNNDYKIDDLPIIPVHLLAARKAIDEEDEYKKEQLFKGSRIEELLKILNDTIEKSGYLKKSQTIYDSSVMLLQSHNARIKQYKDEINTINCEFNTNTKKLSDSIDKKTKKAKEKVSEVIDNVFDAFIQDELEIFARDHRHIHNNDELSKAFECFIKKSDFERKIRNEVEKVLNNYKNDIQDAVDDFTEDNDFSINFGKISQIKLEMTFDFKFAVKIGLIVLEAVGLLLTVVSPVIPIVTSLVSIVGSFIADKVLKRKSDKELQNKNKIYDTIKSGLDKSRGQIKKDVLKLFSDFELNNIVSLKKSVSYMKDSFNEMEKSLDNIYSSQQRHITQINILLVKRVLNYAFNKNIFKMDNLKDKGIGLSFSRDIGKQLKIYFSYSGGKLRLNRSTDNISKTMQEKVIIIQD